MIRIVGVQRSSEVKGEFVLLQNQGSMRVNLRAHAVIADATIQGGTSSPAAHFFGEDVDILPGQYILLRTVPCRTGWSTTNDGQRVYQASMSCPLPVWANHPGALHVLTPQHTFVERSAELLSV
ncbi:MAG: hypothetical protein KIT11_03885 [Fimbriimonadaceae bacterium]|nr:hypothetical protein [Fimbriimonadaceae bacterium]QYK56962.1 MAG: hypothetical protein KF733_05640 [Fimbriimonadaceae bacterium]